MDFSSAQNAITDYVNFLISRESPGMAPAARMQINAAIAGANQLGRDLMTAQMVEDQKALDALKANFTNEATLLNDRTKMLKGVFNDAADAAQAVAISLAIGAAIAAL